MIMNRMDNYRIILNKNKNHSMKPLSTLYNRFDQEIQFLLRLQTSKYLICNMRKHARFDFFSPKNHLVCSFKRM